MIRAAGILFLDPSKSALFLKRGPGGDYAGYWCFPGGRQEGSETIEECAVREAIEECGKIPSGKRVEWTRSVSSQVNPNSVTEAPPNAEQEQVDYTTFLQCVKEQFVPTINGEHVGFAWAPISAPPQPMHPGCEVALLREGMDELGIARAMADGRLTSPQVYENVTLWNIRITGTGAAYRTKWKEYVWRDASIYMNDEFLARCNGLAVIWAHPEKKPTIDSKEFNDRIVGTVFLPYLKQPDEVWAIVKIYDDAANALMREGQMSTSPAVVFKDPDVNTELTTQGGERLLIEGKPSLLDHLAICERGVWDKGGEPTGVSLTRKDDQPMTPEEKAALEEKARKDAEARARADAETNGKLDKLLTGIDAVAADQAEIKKRLDRQDADIAALKAKDDDDDDKAKKDRAKKDDDDARKDAEESMAKYSDRKDDDDDDSFKKRHDAEEESEVAERLKKGEAKEVAADKAKKHRKDAEEKQMKAFADRKARKDSVSRADLDAVINRLPRVMTDEERRLFAEAQARADGVFRAFGDAAPVPMQGEDPNAYRRRLATMLKKHSPNWKDVDLDKVRDDTALKVCETQIYADAQVAADRPDPQAEGIVYRTRHDSQLGRPVTVGIGRHSFIRQFKPEVRRVERGTGGFMTKRNHLGQTR